MGDENAEALAATAPEAPTAITNNNVADEPATKHFYRKKVWDYLEKNRLVNFPRPAYGRIPNFKGANDAAQKLIELDVFKAAAVVEVNPDKPLEHARMLVLEGGKELYVPVPRLEHGLLRKLTLDHDAKIDMRQLVSRWGIENASQAVKDEDKVHVDLVVVGSVAVAKTGHRIGKGQGFADLEFAILREIRAVDDNTVIVTTVHDCQVFDVLPPEIFQIHDVPIDYILTPTQVIKVDRQLPRPTGIYWNLLSERRLNMMPILKEIKELQASQGKDTTLKSVNSEVDLNHHHLVNGEKSPRKSKLRTRREKQTTDDDNGDDTKKPGKFRYSRRFFRRTKSAVGGVPVKYNDDGTAVKGDEDSSGGRVVENNGKIRSRAPRRPRSRFHVDFSLLVSNIERSVRVRQLKVALIENGIKPMNITWRGYKGFCYLHYAKPLSAALSPPPPPLSSSPLTADNKAVDVGDDNDAKPPPPVATTENNKSFGVDSVIEILEGMKISPESTANLKVKVVEPITRIETTDVTAV